MRPRRVASSGRKGELPMSADESKKIGMAIDGVFLQPLRVLSTPGGPVMHMLRPGFALMPELNGFGEIYFSEVWPHCIKGWKKHNLQTQLFAVPAGLLHIVLYDGREDSPTKDVVCELKLGRPENYNLLRIPPGIWYAFTPVGDSLALICNFADIPHNPEESEKLPLENGIIPYQWQ